MTTTTTLSHTKGGETPVFHVTEEHDHDGQSTVIGFWMFLMSDVLLFCGLFAIYAWLGGHYANGPAPLDDGHGGQLFHLPAVAVNTVVMLLSSFAVAIAMVETRKRNVGSALKWYGATALLGAVFLFNQVTEYGHLASIGATYDVSAFLSCFITLIVAHSLHVVAGLVWVAVLAVQVLQHGLNDANERRAVCFSMFWNFLDITWVCVFIFVYLMGVLR
jgi:cytochrome o ubiquinol oxidase subunit 3